MTYDEAKDWICENIPDYVPPKPKVGDFSKFIFPVIANMMPQESLFDLLVDVQPMQQPVNLFYLDFAQAEMPWWKRCWRKIILICHSSSVSRAGD